NNSSQSTSFITGVLLLITVLLRYTSPGCESVPLPERLPELTKDPLPPDVPSRVARFLRPIHRKGFADYEVGRHGAPISAVLAAVSIVPHAEILIGVIASIVVGIVRIAILRSPHFLRQRIPLLWNPECLPKAEPCSHPVIIITLAIHRVQRPRRDPFVHLLFKLAGIIWPLIGCSDPVLRQLLAVD